MKVTAPPGAHPGICAKRRPPRRENERSPLRVRLYPLTTIWRFAAKAITITALERLRDDMDGYAASRFPDRNRPQIQHITLFRYREALPLPPLVQACSALPAWQQTWRIDQLELVHETAYPLLAGRLVGDWPLRG